MTADDGRRTLEAAVSAGKNDNDKNWRLLAEWLMSKGGPKMTDKRWKATERATAKALGARRNPNNGEHRADINPPGFCIEHKSRKDVPKWLSEAVQQAVGAAEDGETPLVVLCHSLGRGRPQRRYVVMRFEDWLDWYGGGE